MGHSRGESRDTHEQKPLHSTPARAAPDAEHERLQVFVGSWHMEGRQLEGPAGSAATISAFQKYEWLPGGQFLVHRFDGHVGGSQAACVEIIGVEERRGYRAHTFYDNGRMNVWDITHRDGEWRAMGDWNAGDRYLKVRCTTTFADDGQTMDSKWEHSQDGHAWQTFWEVSARKVVEH
jgi:hypothetical protein